YRSAIAADPKSHTGHINLGASLHKQKKLDEAIVHYRRALALDPGNAAAFNNLGGALRDQNKLNEAIDCYRKALGANPEHAMAWCNLGHALRQQQKYAQSLAAFRRGHELGSLQNDWSYPSAQWVRETEGSLELRLAAVALGQPLPADGRERL